MRFLAKARYVRCSPYKLRSLVNVVRGKDAEYALNWLKTYPIKRARPIKKIIESAIANAKNMQNLGPEDLRIKEICVDHGPTYRYFKPGAMGRSVILRKRFSHIRVILENIEKQEV